MMLVIRIILKKKHINYTKYKNYNSIVSTKIIISIINNYNLYVRFYHKFQTSTNNFLFIYIYRILIYSYETL